jgi:hypothetical protein
LGVLLVALGRWAESVFNTVVALVLHVAAAIIVLLVTSGITVASALGSLLVVGVVLTIKVTVGVDSALALTGGFLAIIVVKNLTRFLG